MTSGEYRDDAFKIDDDTSADELIDYVRGRIEGPIEIHGTTVYNFSSHPVDTDALEDAVENKLQRETYLVPIQVTGAMMFISTLLPQQIREADYLIYRSDKNQYYAYKSFNRELADESRRAIRQEFSEEIRKQ